MKLFAFTFIATFLFVGISSSDPEEKWKDDSQKWYNQCAEELKISEDKVKEYQSMTEPPVEEMDMCFTACILEKSGMMVDGKLHEETVDAIIKEFEDMKGISEVMPEIAKKCHKEANAKTEKCEIAGALSQCIYEGIDASMRPAA